MDTKVAKKPTEPAPKQNPVYKTVTIGNLKISLFSLIVVVSGLVAGLFVSYMTNPVVGLILIAGSFLGAYNLNCVIVGDCKMWAWVLLVTYVLNSLLVFVPYFAAGSKVMSMSKSSKSKK